MHNKPPKNHTCPWHSKTDLKALTFMVQ
uniref:Uncharacterized protein n=1 Tax=Arundo donax TaxID=35708 RepID=A0A0A8ZJX4_ARUDO